MPHNKEFYFLRGLVTENSPNFWGTDKNHIFPLLEYYSSDQERK